MILELPYQARPGRRIGWPRGRAEALTRTGTPTFESTSPAVVAHLPITRRPSRPAQARPSGRLQQARLAQRLGEQTTDLDGAGRSDQDRCDQGSVGFVARATLFADFSLTASSRVATCWSCTRTPEGCSVRPSGRTPRVGNRPARRTSRRRTELAGRPVRGGVLGYGCGQRAEGGARGAVARAAQPAGTVDIDRPEQVRRVIFLVSLCR